MFLAGLILMAGAAICGSDPTKFQAFGFFDVAGHVVLGVILFITGLALWFDGLLE